MKIAEHIARSWAGYESLWVARGLGRVAQSNTRKTHISGRRPKQK